MRGLKDIEYAELRALDVPGDYDFHGPTLDDLMTCRRIREYDVTEDGYRIEITNLGRLAMKLWPMNRIAQ